MLSMKLNRSKCAGSLDVFLQRIALSFSINSFNKKSNLYYTRGVTPKRVTIGGIHLRGLAPGQHSSEETSQRWRVVGDTLFDLTGPGIEPSTSLTESDVLTTTQSVLMVHNIEVVLKGLQH